LLFKKKEKLRISYYLIPKNDAQAGLIQKQEVVNSSFISTSSLSLLLLFT